MDTTEFTQTYGNEVKAKKSEVRYLKVVMDTTELTHAYGK